MATESTIAGSMPDPTLDQRHERLTSIGELEAGWLDGSGKKISATALDATRKYIDSLSAAGAPLPSMFPMENGGVQIEWASGNHVYSVEISHRLGKELVFDTFFLDIPDGNTALHTHFDHEGETFDESLHRVIEKFQQ